MTVWAMKELFLDDVISPRLLGQKCGCCAAVAFPPNPHGCESCGATPERLFDHPLDGYGQLRAFATTHLSSRKDLKAPFTVAVIALDGGPVIRALMTAPTDEGLSVGAAVRAKIVSLEDGGRQLRFEPTGNP